MVLAYGNTFWVHLTMLKPSFFQVSHFLSYINPWWPWGAFKWTCNFLPPFMSRAFKLTIINIYFDWPLACRSQLYNEGMRRNISSFQKNWKDPTVAKFKLSSWGNYWNFCAFVNLDVDPRLHLYICTHTHTHIHKDRLGNIYARIWQEFKERTRLSYSMYYIEWWTIVQIIYCWCYLISLHIWNYVML